MIQRYKSLVGIVLSLLIHLLLLAVLLRQISNRKFHSYQPTTTRGYTVDVVSATEAQKQFMQHAVPSSQAGSNDAIAQSPKQINFAAPIQVNIPSVTEHKPVPSKLQHQLNRRHITLRPNMRHNITVQRVQQTPNQKHTRGIKPSVLPIPPKTLIVSHTPDTSINQIGSGDLTNSSTNGHGHEAGLFDFRVIEYGRQTAYLVNQNIVIPTQYRYTPITYRAFVVLDHNMQFQAMKVIKSTGNNEYDTNIARALRQTIYPPLPTNANWQQYKNIDFTIGIYRDNSVPPQ